MYGVDNLSGLEDTFNRFTATDVRVALGQVGKHPLRGSETSYDGITDNGVIRHDGHRDGVKLRSFDGSYSFSLTETGAGRYVTDTYLMSAASFPRFIAAMFALLGVERSTAHA